MRAGRFGGKGPRPTRAVENPLPGRAGRRNDRPMPGFPEPPLSPPVIEPEGGGLVLRPWRDGDRHMLREAAVDPALVDIGGVPRLSSEQATMGFIAHQRRLAREGMGYPLVVDGQGAAVGAVGLWRDRMDAGRASAGYWLLPAARGRGLASRAVAALARWGLEELGLARVELHIEPWNTASLRVAERAGFEREGLLRSYLELNGRRRDLVVWSVVAARCTP